MEKTPFNPTVITGKDKFLISAFYAALLATSVVAMPAAMENFHQKATELIESTGGVNSPFKLCGGQYLYYRPDPAGPLPHLCR